MSELGLGSNFEYKYISEKDKRLILTNQLRELEANHFSLTVIEPSRLQEENAHLQWRQSITVIEQNIRKLRMKMSELGEEEE